jgi:hypothetical protein
VVLAPRGMGMGIGGPAPHEPVQRPSPLSVGPRAVREPQPGTADLAGAGLDGDRGGVARPRAVRTLRICSPPRRRWTLCCSPTSNMCGAHQEVVLMISSKISIHPPEYSTKPAFFTSCKCLARLSGAQHRWKSDPGLVREGGHALLSARRGKWRSLSTGLTLSPGPEPNERSRTREGGPDGPAVPRRTILIRL